MFSVRRGKQATASVPARGTIQLLLARSCFLMSGYIITVILARGLGPAEFGVYGVLMSVLVWIETIGSAGVPSATAKLIPQYPTRAAAVEQSAQVLLALLSFGLFGLGWILASTFADIFNLPHGVWLFRLAILDLPCSGLYFAYRGILQGHRRFGLLSSSMMIYSGTKVVGLLVLFIFGLSVTGALLVNVLATVSALIYLVSKVPLTVSSWPAWPLIGTMARLALPMGVFLVLSQILSNLDLWSLQSLWTGPEATVGIYVASLNLARMLIIVPSVLSVVLFTSLSWALARQNEVLAQRHIQSASRFACMVLFPICAVLAIHAEPVLELLYAGSYAAGSVFLTLQLVAFGGRALLDLYLSALMAAGKYYQSVGLLLALLPIAFLSNLVLIPQYGALGAATALMGITLPGMMIAAVCAYRRFGALIKGISLARITLATALTAWLGTSRLHTEIGLLLEFVVLLVTYVLVLSLLKELRWDDLKAFAVWEKTAP